MNSACAEILLHKMLVTPHLRRIKFFEFLGTLFYFTCSAEMNSACAEILLHKMLVTPHLRRITAFSDCVYKLSAAHLRPHRRLPLPGGAVSGAD